MRHLFAPSKARPSTVAFSRIRVPPTTGEFKTARLSTKSGEAAASSAPRDEGPTPPRGPVVEKEDRKKTMAELDEELRSKLEGMSGDGGAAGVEYENGKAEGLKRGVKSNMFRVI